MDDAQHKPDHLHEHRDELFMDVDRMINEGLGGGRVTRQNGLIEDTITDTMKQPDSILDQLYNREKRNEE